jgi:hypothetical protein
VIENIKWLTIGEYSVEKAEEKMHEYIKVFDKETLPLDVSKKSVCLL